MRVANGLTRIFLGLYRTCVRWRNVDLIGPECSALTMQVLLLWHAVWRSDLRGERGKRRAKAGGCTLPVETRTGESGNPLDTTIGPRCSVTTTKGTRSAIV